LIDERDGALKLGVGVAGLDLAWDSRAAQSGNRFDLGEGWGFGYHFLETSGGVRLMAPSGEVFEADESAASGLLGYTLADLKLKTVADEALPPRAGLSAPADAAYALYELGGAVTYFNAVGNPVAQITPFGDRTDLRWSARDPRRLERIVDADGVVTELDWTSEPGVLIVRRGADLALGADLAGRGWRVDFGASGGVSRVVDPEGGELRFGYDGTQVSRITTASGATTEIGWQTLDDGTPRVHRVHVLDHTGMALSTRSWGPVGGASPSGWPLLDGAGSARLPALADFKTELSDGATTVRSTYTAQHQLRVRDVAVSTAAGEQLIQRQTIDYPHEALTAAGAKAAGTLQSRPERIEVTHVGGSGASRSTATSFAYDASGRVVRESSDDGTLTETTYDDVIPAGAELPNGLTVRETTTTPDGFVREVVSDLNDARTAATTTRTVVSGGREKQPPTVTDHVEYTVQPDGFVSEQREFPTEDASGAPAVTRWSETIDVPNGTRSIVETRGAGTAAEASVTETTSLLHGATLERTDEFGHSSTTEYDVLDRVIAETDVAGNATRTYYETWQRDGRNATVVTAADGVATTEVRDELDRVILRTDNIDHGVATDGHVRTVERIDHDLHGTVRITDAWGATSSVSMDAFGRQVRSVGPTGLTEVTDHDDVAERVSRGTTPTGRLADAEFVTVSHEPTASLTSTVAIDRADGVDVPESSEIRDGLGRAVSQTDGFLRTEARYDAFGRPVATTISPGHGDNGSAAGSEVDAITADRHFDGFGHLAEKELSDGTGSTSSGTRIVDELGRIRSETDRAGRTTGFEYSLDGLVTSVVRDDGLQTRNTYDPTTRTLTESVTTSPIGAAVSTRYEDDPVTGRPLAVFDPADRAGTEITYSYDAHGNLREVEYPDGSRVRYGYDLHGRRLTTTDPAGNVTSFEHDHAGVLVAAVQRDSDGDELARVGYELDQLGRLIKLSRGNGVDTASTYTSAGEIASEVTTSGGRELTARAYEYDARGLLTQRVDRTNRGERGERTTTTRYTYDARERLIASTVRDGDGDGDGDGDAEAPSTATSYELSVVGDVLAESTTSRESGSEHAATRRFEYSPIGELLAIEDETGRVEQTYDTAGNLTRAADGTTYAYDAQNRPVAEVARDGAVTAIAYWADGSRRSLTAAAADGSVRSTEFVWDGATLVEETHRAGDEVTGRAAYLIGAGRHARTVTMGGDAVTTGGDAATGYFGTDRHGNVTELTDRDGTLTEQYTYTDYGAETTASSRVAAAVPTCSSQAGDAARNPFRYSGEYTDPSCRQHLGARTYDATSMRFTGMDTAAVMNPFAYTDANPITRVDPTGHMTEEERIWNFIALGLGLAGLVGSGLAFLAPMSRFMAGLVLAAGAGDVVGVASASIREYGRDELSPELDEDLAILDVVVGAAIVGIAFGARGVHHWVQKRFTGSSVEHVFDSSPTVWTRDAGSGGGSAGPHVLASEEAPLVRRSTAGGSQTHVKIAMSSGSGDARSYTMFGKDKTPVYVDNPTGSKSYSITPGPPATTRPGQRPTPPGRPYQPQATGAQPATRVSGRGNIQRTPLSNSPSGSNSSSSSTSEATPTDPMNVWSTLLRTFS
jgi:RHS repeat-associated protein